MKPLITIFYLILTGMAALLFSQDNKVFLTVYNQNLALVKEIRSATLSPENSTISISNIPGRIIPNSVLLESLNDKNFEVQEQVFEYDLLNSRKILQKYQGKEIQIVEENGSILKGTLLNFVNNELILQDEQGIRIIPRSEKQQIILEKLPEGFVLHPTLRWRIARFQEKKQKLSLRYLTTGLNWRATYVGLLNANENRMTLSAQVFIQNESGVAYRNAKLRLVAGEIHRVRERPVTTYSYQAKVMSDEISAPQFQQKPLSEYYSFTLNRPFSIDNNESKQITLFSPIDVSVTKNFVYRTSVDPTRVLIYINFPNTKENHLGTPLPAGVIRIYKATEDASEFLGEDRIKHTPENEKVELFVGKAFDITAERVVLERKRISSKTEIQKIQIQFKNQKNKDIQILVKEQFSRPSWEIEESSHPYKKKSVSECNFFVPVKKNQTTTLTYRVRYTW